MSSLIGKSDPPPKKGHVLPKSGGAPILAKVIFDFHAFPILLNDLRFG